MSLDSAIRAVIAAEVERQLAERFAGKDGREPAGSVAAPVSQCILRSIGPNNRVSQRIPLPCDRTRGLDRRSAHDVRQVGLHPVGEPLVHD